MKGICFIEPLHGKTVKKIKVQTRRIIPNCDSLRESPFKKSGYETWHGKELKPRYNVGEILYLKEPYYELPFGGYQYKFDENIFYYEYKNKLFMPASAARHFIKIIAVRGERLQDISNEDCIKEGIEEERNWGNGTEWFTYCNGTHSFDTPREAYKALINSIDGKDTWDNNPWVWVYNYSLCNREGVEL